MVEALTVEIDEADKDLEAQAEGDETCRRLMTVPGVGPVTAIRFVAALDEVGRFANAHQVESYLGLVPGESSSSERQQRLSITKAGPTALRWVLVQAAWVAENALSDSQRQCRCNCGLTGSSFVGESESRRWRWRGSWRVSSTRSGATGRSTTAGAAQR